VTNASNLDKKQRAALQKEISTWMEFEDRIDDSQQARREQQRNNREHLRTVFSKRK